jgi:ribosomal protein L11 methylase PrmA
MSHLHANVDPSFLDHYTKQQFICRELKETRRRIRREFRALNQEQKDDYIDYRNRFKNEFINQTLVEQRLITWANDCFEPVNLGDNSTIQREWRATYMAPDEVPISYA